MKLKLVSIAILFLLFSCKNEKKAETLAVDSTQQIEAKQENASLDLEVYDFAGFEKFLKKKDGKIHVINFWATWCAPCVKELPYFEKLYADYKDRSVEVLLVSLDFPHLYDKKLKPFIKKHQLQSKVVALDDPDMNSWIPKISEAWSGSIPATLIYKNDTREFYEQSFDYDELKAKINPFLNH
ncbi:TlpA family protein disulfide reductase [Tamlana crocina]|uniref:Redoxin domain-containing protein n=1 Tax=Tamlana crocina TaxID=393006 RepID=A0ABX1DHD4_9FLAO|nr:TlpA family protein disulfide reductase [Tamlana crocina]NJX16428.1 redoxin domain-containing protein [Tamlana crocina]